MKKLNLLFTALLFLCCVGTATAHDFFVSGIYYSITDATNKTVKVTYEGKYSDEYTGNVVIPESVTYNGTTYSVTSIGDYAFSGCTGLTSITIPNSVTNIGEGAFYSCTGLTSITIPNGVTSIGSSAFEDCTGLTSVVIGNCVTSIGVAAFYNCNGLTSITIPNSVTSIEDYAFFKCKGLTSITIPNSVTSIGERALEGCSGLTSVVIGNSVTSIGSSTFSNCTGLTSITSLIPAESLFVIDSFAFYQVDKTVCTLYVPVGAKETYASTGGWKDFVNIVEKDFTGIEEVFDEVKGEPTVDASQIGKVKTVYDLNGRAVKNPAKGIYIINGKKVLIK